jgi:SSS family solute:Na+ symporter
MGFDVSTGAAYAVLYCILITFTLLALASAGWFDSFLPDSVTALFVLRHRNDGTPDYFLAARNSAGPSAIALSFFASGMGAWVLYGTTEMGATPQLSWLGVLGYSGASAFPALLICWIGPRVREMSKEDAFSTTDFGRQRYGRVMQLAIAAVSIFYMFIFIVAELTAISTIFADITNTYSTIYGVGITLSLGIFTILYTSGTAMRCSKKRIGRFHFLANFLTHLFSSIHSRRSSGFLGDRQVPGRHYGYFGHHVDDCRHGRIGKSRQPVRV